MLSMDGALAWAAVGFVLAPASGERSESTKPSYAHDTVRSSIHPTPPARPHSQSLVHTPSLVCIRFHSTMR
jgi:hypothetical protein